MIPTKNKKLQRLICQFFAGKSETQVVELPIVDMLSPRPAQLPLAIPRDLSEQITRLHGDPTVWWIGQFMKYLLRYQPDTDQMLNQAKETMKFQKPIVGYFVDATLLMDEL